MSLYVATLTRSEIALAEATVMAEHLARHDPLTGLPKRCVFDEALADRYDHADPVAQLCIDLDDFEAVNNTFGHAAGYEILKMVASRLRKVAGAVLRARRQERHGTAAAEILFRLVADTYRIGTRDVRSVGASVGLAFETGFGADDLARAADDACYAAKHAGRRTWRRARWPMPQAA